MKWCRIAPNGLIWSINFQNFSWRACSQTPQKGLPPSAVTIILFNHFRSWFLIFSLFKWSVPALWYRPFTCKLCVVVFFWTVDILHLYIVKEGFSFFLMNIFHSPLIRYERGGRGRRRSVISFRFFFHNHSDLSLLESGRSANICVPWALTWWARAGHLRVPIDVGSDECWWVLFRT